MLEQTVELQVATRKKMYSVKLYHPIDEGIPCPNMGQAVRFTVEAVDKSEIRRIESKTNKHGFFKGDRCEKCGVLAKVSLMEE